jgi:tetratricopeptide repeat protein 30
LRKERFFFIDTAAREALTDMPPRNVNELDTITLHNLAIMNMEEDATGGFEKLTFLISNETFPRETFVNLCLLYLKYEVSTRNLSLYI